ncbi:metallophosphoesterase family protein [Streptomyces olivochromogenes]|uniref:Phosphatase n=1 Tax=Streptomyces olivochromogenes TaxID=1963 RepID=A0A250VGS6_STROL|nr:metallophosphoesterase [Streptomyces olivochromogenes]GAX53393.1 phosphatase [Streptomyces olivochromogenes]
MRYRIAALVMASALATAVPAIAVPADATPPRIAPDSAGPKPPGPTPPPGTTPPPGAPNGEAWAWTQLTSNGTQIRYVSTDTSQTCPVVRYTLGVNRNPHSLHRVSTPGPTSQFPTTVCELRVPLTASNAVLEQTSIQAATVHPANRQLPLPKWTSNTRPSKIAVIGDAGCEVPATGPVQNCANHQTGWPFQRIADSAATVTKPDLVIHTGDYLYREDPSRENDKAANPGCTTFADRASWDCVIADFFRPAEKLLAAAPIALTRGNHEDCTTHPGGAGGAWFRYLADDLRSNGSCSVYPAPSLIPAGTLTLASVDSSFADPSDNGSTAQRGIYARQFQAVNQAALQSPANDFFVVTHKPLWMVKASGNPPNSAEWLTRVLDAAVADTSLHRLADNVRLVLSGHIHLYQMLDFNSPRPPQLTVGSSGGTLDNGPDDTKVVGQLIGTQPPQAVTQSITQEQNPPQNLAGVFGYAVLNDNAGTWNLTFHDTAGAVRGKTCALSASKTNKSFACH